MALIQRFKLKNGLNVCLYRIPSARSIYVSITAKGGVLHETEKNNGISHFMEHLLVEGTPSFPSAEKLSEYIEGLAGTFNAQTTRTMVRFYVRLPEAQYQKAVQITKEVFFEPLFLPKAVEKERRAILAEVKTRKDTVEYKIWRFASDHRFKEKSKLRLEVMGDLKVLKSLSGSQLKNFWRKVIVPSNSYLLIAGNFSLPEIKKEVLEQFCVVSAHSYGIFEPRFNNAELSSRTIAIRCDRKLNVVYVDLSFPTEVGRSDPRKLRSIEFFATRILGGITQSRLYKALRLQKGLAYSVDIGDMMIDDMSFININSEVMSQNLDSALQVIVQELYQFVTNGPTDEEVEFIKNYLFNRWMMQYDNVGNIVSWLEREFLWEKRMMFPEDYIKVLRHVSKRDILSLMKQYWDLSRLNLVLQGPVENTKTNKEKFARIVQILK